MTRELALGAGLAAKGIFRREATMSHHKKPHEHRHEEPSQPPAPVPETTPAGPAAAQPSAAPEAVEDIAAVKAQRDDYLARLQRLSADFANYQKRAQREMIDIREHANADLLKGILPIMDDMERAMKAAAEKSTGDDPLLRGIELVHTKALQILEGCGLKPMQTTGQPFDPTQHQAVMQLPTADQPPGTVVQELQRGYLLKGRTLRPATVVVSKEPEAAADAEPNKNE